MLKSGGRFTGRILEHGEEVQVQGSRGKMVFPRAQVASIERGKGKAGSGRKEAPAPQGDDPAEACLAWHRAVVRGDWEAVRKGLAREKIAELEEAGAAEALDLLRKLLPSEAAVSSCRVSGKAAEVELHGLEGGRPSGREGQVRLVFEGGAWKVIHVTWNLDLPAPPVPPRE